MRRAKPQEFPVSVFLSLPFYSSRSPLFPPSHLGQWESLAGRLVNKQESLFFFFFFFFSLVFLAFLTRLAHCLFSWCLKAAAVSAEVALDIHVNVTSLCRSVRIRRGNCWKCVCWRMLGLFPLPSLFPVFSLGLVNPAHKDCAEHWLAAPTTPGPILL